MFFKISMLLLLPFLLFACTEPPYTNLNNAQLKELMAQGVPIYDVRRADEWQQTGIIEGSRPLTIIGAEARVNANFMPSFTRSISKDSPVILICRTGSRTRKLAMHLIEEMGYTQVYNVRDGISQWIREGNAVVRARF